MGNMDGWACPNVAVQLGSECVWRCRCSAECCWRLMGGGGHIVSAPTKHEGASRASGHMRGLCVLAWGCDVMARACRMEGRPRCQSVPEHREEVRECLEWKNVGLEKKM